MPTFETRKPFAVVVSTPVNTVFLPKEKERLEKEIADKLKGSDYEGTPVICLDQGRTCHLIG